MKHTWKASTFFPIIALLFALAMTAACTPAMAPSQAPPQPSSTENDDQQSSSDDEPMGQPGVPSQPENYNPPSDTVSSTQMDESVLKVILAEIEAGRAKIESIQQTIASLELEKSKTATNEDALKAVKAQLDTANATLEALKKNNADLQAKYAAEEAKQAAAAAASICSPDQDGDGVYDRLPDSCAAVSITNRCGYNYNNKKVDKFPSCEASTFSFTDEPVQGGGTLRQYQCCFDNCPIVSNPDQKDSDFDGMGDVCIYPFDKDHDYIKDSLDNCPDVPNNDQYVAPNNYTDGTIGDACNPDMDGDGIYDKKAGADGQPILDPDNNNNPVEIPAAKICGNSNALVPDTKEKLVPCTKEKIDNCCYDNCPVDSNEDQTNEFDSEHVGLGDACHDDLDGDDVPNESDNCPTVWNPADSNGNQTRTYPLLTKLGDACNPDIDGDGVLDKEISADGKVIVGSDFHVKPRDEAITCGDPKAKSKPPCTKTAPTNCCYDNCELVKNGDCYALATNCDISGKPSAFELLTGNQADYDSNGKGDACTKDIDGDDALNEDDPCPYLASVEIGGDPRLCDGKSAGHSILSTVLSPPVGNNRYNPKDFAAEPKGFYALDQYYLSGFEVYSTKDYTNYYVAQNNKISTFKIDKTSGAVDTDHSVFAPPSAVSSAIRYITAIRKVAGQPYLLIFARDANSKYTGQLWSVHLNETDGLVDLSKVTKIASFSSPSGTTLLDQASIGIKTISSLKTDGSKSDCSVERCAFVAFISSPEVGSVYGVKFKSDMSPDGEPYAIDTTGLANTSVKTMTAPRSTFVDGDYLYIGVADRVLKVKLGDDAKPDQTTWVATQPITNYANPVDAVIYGFAKVGGLDNLVFFTVSTSVYAMTTDGTVIRVIGRKDFPNMWGFATTFDPNTTLPITIGITAPRGMAADKNRLLIVDNGSHAVLGIDFVSNSDPIKVDKAEYVIGQWPKSITKSPVKNPWTFDMFGTPTSIRVFHDSGPMSYAFISTYYNMIFKMTFYEDVVQAVELFTGVPKYQSLTRYVAPDEWRLYGNGSTDRNENGLLMMRIDKSGNITQKMSQIWSNSADNAARYSSVAIAPSGKEMFLIQQINTATMTAQGLYKYYPPFYYASLGPDISVLKINPADGLPPSTTAPTSKAKCDNCTLPWKYPFFIDTYHDSDANKDYLLVISNDIATPTSGWGEPSASRSDVLYRAQITENVDGTVTLSNVEILAGGGTTVPNDGGIAPLNTKFTTLNEARYFDGNIWISEPQGPSIYRYDLKTNLVYRVVQRTKGRFLVDGEFDVGASFDGLLGFDFLQFGNTKGLLLTEHSFNAIRLLR